MPAKKPLFWVSCARVLYAVAGFLGMALGAVLKRDGNEGGCMRVLVCSSSTGGVDATSSGNKSIGECSEVSS